MSLSDHLFYAEPGITLYCGDCREVLPLLPFRPAPVGPNGWMLAYDSLVTDPPYGLGDVLWQGGNVEWPLKGAGMNWDRVPVDEVPEVVASARYAIVWGGQFYSLPPARGWLIWDKIVRDFTSGHCEMAWTNLAQPNRAYSYATCLLATEGKYHPTQKPLPLMRWCLGFLPPGEHVICDPFAGAGTTLRAAKDLGHPAIGIEIEPRYCEIAVKRLRQEVLPL